jgi:hypothetical protein
VRALALDSAPQILTTWCSGCNGRTNMNSDILQFLARTGIKVYSFGKFPTKTSCELARSLNDPGVLLLAGRVGDPWRQSTLDLVSCFRKRPEIKSDLTLTGPNLPSSTGEEEEAYDRPVIEFFDKSLR